MIKNEFEDYKRALSKKWDGGNYFIDEVKIKNVFNWKDSSIKFFSPISVVTGKNGAGKSTIINAIKQTVSLQNGNQEFGVLHNLSDYEIIVINRHKQESIVKNKELSKNDFKLPPLVDLTFNLKSYSLFRHSTGEDMLAYQEILKQYDTAILEEPYLSTLRELIAKNIVLAEKIIDEEDEERAYYRLTLADGTKYDSYTMGSGEFFINEFIWKIKDISESIVIIEEPETFLHSEAQESLIHFLHKISVTKSIQIIITTHSHSLIDTLSKPSLILIKNEYEKNISAINNCEHWLAKDVLGDKSNIIEVIVEDEKGKDIVFNLISLNNPDLIKHIIITPVGGDGNIKKLIDLNLQLKTSKLIGILDGDSRLEEKDFVLKLPLRDLPEITIVNYGLENYKLVAAKLDKNEDELAKAFSEGMTKTDPHEWVSKIAYSLGEEKNFFWATLVRLWCKNNLTQPEVVSFFEKFVANYKKLT